MPSNPFVGPTYPLISRAASVQRTINMVPVPLEPGNERTDWVFKDIPGYTQITTTNNIVAAFTYVASSLQYTFTDTSAIGPVTWAWNFGDGSGTSTSQNPVYTYAAPGTYTVTLTVTNAASKTSTKTQTIVTGHAWISVALTGFTAQTWEAITYSPTLGMYAAIGNGPILIPITEEQLLAIESTLQDFGEQELEGFQVRCVLERGDPGTKITCFAHTHEVGLIALGTHGYGPFRRFLLGSVAAKVLHDARCPVLTNRHQATAETKQPGSLKRVLCCVDTLRPSAGLLREAAQLASHLDARLAFAHVVQVPEPALALNFGATWEIEIMDLAKQQLQEKLAEAGVTGDLFVRLGNPSQVIPHLLETLHSDLVVLGNTGSPQADQLLRHAPCPVLSIRA